MTGGSGRVNGARHVVITRLQPVHTNNQDHFEVTAAEDETGDDGQWAVQAFAIGCGSSEVSTEGIVTCGFACVLIA